MPSLVFLYDSGVRWGIQPAALCASAMASISADGPVLSGRHIPAIYAATAQESPAMGYAVRFVHPQSPPIAFVTSKVFSLSMRG